MLIALDYDDTYTRDSKFWLFFIAAVEYAQHDIICVTMRTEAERALIDPEFLDLMGERIYCTSRQAKKDYMNGLGIFPDIWIDDTPEFIVKDALVE